MTIHKEVTGSGRLRYRQPKFPSNGLSIWDTSDGISRIVASTNWSTNRIPITSSKHDPAAIECFFARGLPRLQHRSCLPCAECEARRTPEQDPNLLGQTYLRRAVLRSDSFQHAGLRIFAPPVRHFCSFREASSRSSCLWSLWMAYADPLSSSKSYANYRSRLSRGQKRFIATLNVPDSHFALRRCGIAAGSRFTSLRIRLLKYST
jgi:hypothetical protein